MSSEIESTVNSSPKSTGDSISFHTESTIDITTEMFADFIHLNWKYWDMLFVTCMQNTEQDIRWWFLPLYSVVWNFL